MNPEVIPPQREFSLKGGKPASTSNSPKFSQLTVSVGMFPQKTHLFTAMLWHQFLQQLWRDCNFESIMMQYHPNQNSCLSDSVLYLPMNLICGCVWKPPNQSWIYRTSSQGLNKDHLVMESRKTNHPVTFN